MAVEDKTRCLNVAQDIINCCKAGGGIVSSRLAEVVDILRHVKAARIVFSGDEPRVGRDKLAEDGEETPFFTNITPCSMRR